MLDWGPAVDSDKDKFDLSARDSSSSSCSVCSEGIGDAIVCSGVCSGRGRSCLFGFGGIIGLRSALPRVLSARTADEI